jgi:ribose 5-phosphate isomerase A
MTPPLSQDTFKKQAAEYAIDTYVQSGMVLGLGMGSTARYAHLRLAERLKNGELKNIVGIPCSRHVEALARNLGIPLTDLEHHPKVDLVYDGADEVDPALNLIKGGGGALLWEKIVHQSATTRIIIVDEGKRVARLGTRWPIPVEVIPFGLGAVRAYLEDLGAKTRLRRAVDDVPFRTDENNLILDAHFGPLEDLPRMDAQLKARAGIVEHGLFLGLAQIVVWAGAEGVSVMDRQEMSKG